MLNLVGRSLWAEVHSRVSAAVFFLNALRQEDTKALQVNNLQSRRPTSSRVQRSVLAYDRGSSNTPQRRGGEHTGPDGYAYGPCGRWAKPACSGKTETFLGSQQLKQDTAKLRCLENELWSV